MRPIKYRAKDAKTGEWLYGYYVEQHMPEYDNDQPDRITGYTHLPMLFNDEPGLRDSFYWHEVVSDTVGQFTGLRDINGKDIYEGDILDVNYADEESHLDVRFVRGMFAFLWNGDLDDEFPCNAPTHEWAKVIGNIHDNPELLTNTNRTNRTNL